MPEHDTPFEMSGTYTVIAREFGTQLGSALDTEFKIRQIPNWFQHIRDLRQQMGMATYDDPFDARFTLREASIQGSPIASALPGFDVRWKNTASMLMRLLNRWQHFGVNPTAANVEQVCTLILDLAQKSSLEIADHLGRLVPRLRALRDGLYTTDSKASNIAPSREDAEYVRKLEEKVQEQIARPPVGADWLGPLGDRRIYIHPALRDVTENGVSIKNLLPGGDEQVKEWLRYYPKGGDARVSPDGAVTGFIKGQPTLIGWLLKDPAASDAHARGFIVQYDFEFTGTDIVDKSSDQKLSECAVEDISDLLQQVSNHAAAGQMLNLTDFNDLVIENEDGSLKKVASVHPGIWFLGE